MIDDGGCISEDIGGNLGGPCDCARCRLPTPDTDGFEMRIRSWANFIATPAPPMYRVRMDGLLYTLTGWCLVRDDGGDPGDEDPGPHTAEWQDR